MLLGGGTPWLACLFVALMAVERAVPLRIRKRATFPRLVVNVTLTALVFVVGTFIVKRVGLGVAGWNETGGAGILGLFKAAPTLQACAGFLLMDLTFYWWHRLNHELPILWRFHIVHHADPDMDVSTSFRFQPGEVFLSSAFRAAQVALIGVGPATYLLYEVVFQAATMFHHSNVGLPLRVERALNVAAVTPRMHGIHHSAVREETNSNYGTVFLWWDILHRTLNLRVPQGEVDIGVPALQDPGDNRLGRLLSMPFVKQGEDWRYPDGRLSVTRAAPAA